MIRKDFWSNSRVGVIGAGMWGTVLSHLLSRNCQEVRLWSRKEEITRSILSTRINEHYMPSLILGEKIHAFHCLERFFEGGLHAVIWALPSEVTRDQAKKVLPFWKGDEILIHATKGIEADSLKRMSQVLKEEIPCLRIGVLSGPNLALEVARGEATATVIASSFSEVMDAAQSLFSNAQFWVERSRDVIGVEWCGVLKNIFAIACGALDALEVGSNARAMILTLALSEMKRFVKASGGEESTLFGLAGMGDLYATCSTPLSRNYRVGYQLAKHEPLSEICIKLGSTAEGIRTTQTVWQFAQKNALKMPVTESVYLLLEGQLPPEKLLDHVMALRRN